MIAKFKSFRPNSGSPSALIGQITKTCFDIYRISVSYEDVLDDNDYITQVQLSARQLDTGIVENGILQSTTGSVVSGTATGGSTTTLIDTTKNFVTLGVQPGDMVLNTTKGWIARVKRIYKTTNAYDTLEFDAAITAAASSDAYKFRFGKAVLTGGTDAAIYIVSFDSTSSSGYKFQDQILVNVQGADRSADGGA